MLNPHPWYIIIIINIRASFSRNNCYLVSRFGKFLCKTFHAEFGTTRISDN